MSPILPEDIRPAWLSVIRRLQAAVSTCNNSGIAIVSINIVVDNKGSPRFWTEPKVTKIEPKGSMVDIINMIGSVG